MRQATISINPNALHHNIQRIADFLSPTNTNITTGNKNAASKIMVMLKANAYGHGLEICTSILLKNQNVQAIGVATLQEGLQVRKSGWDRDIVLIEGVFSYKEWLTAIRYEMQCVIHHKPQLEWAMQKVPDNTEPTSNIWLKYNTGMNRLGFNAQEITKAAHQLNQSGYHLILTSHFANADDETHPLNMQQGKKFNKKLNELKQNIPEIKASLCNSAGIVNFPQWHYDWVRAGIMIYGSSPVIHRSAEQLNLQSVMTLSAKIIAIHNLAIDEQVGYGSLWTAQKPSRVAIISIGYGDGYPRVVDDTAYVAVTKQSIQHSESDTSLYPCPIIGRVAMDMIVIDITETAEKVTIGDHVILWGTHHLPNCPHVDQIAKSASTIGYELLCRLTTRPNRVILSS